MEATSVPPAAIPVLCVDTCSILDVMRDPTRDTARPADRQVAIDLVTLAEAGGVHFFMPQQVATEFADYDQSIQEEATRNLKKLRDQVARVNTLVGVYGSSAVVDLNHFDDYVVRARGVVARWLAQLKVISPSPHAPTKAFARVNAGIAPAKRGKDSSKDCLVFETVLEMAAAARAAGATHPIVFLSSNTADYLTEGKSLKPDIAKEFLALGVEYAPNIGAAKHALGL